MNLRAEETLSKIKEQIILVANLVDSFPKTTASFKIAGQIMDSVTSIGANFAEAQSARTKKEFVSTIGISLKEAKETLFWLDIVKDLKLTDGRVDVIRQKCIELVKILSSIVLTASGRKKIGDKSSIINNQS
ncbi:MAG: four helix bundle protein [bacterium]